MLLVRSRRAEPRRMEHPVNCGALTQLARTDDASRRPVGWRSRCRAPAVRSRAGPVICNSPRDACGTHDTMPNANEGCVRDAARRVRWHGRHTLAESSRSGVLHRGLARASAAKSALLRHPCSRRAGGRTHRRLNVTARATHPRYPHNRRVVVRLGGHVAAEQSIVNGHESAPSICLHVGAVRLLLAP